MSTGRQHKAYLLRRHQAGGSVLADAGPAAERCAELHQRMSLSAIAKALGTSHNWVSRLISGDTKRISHQRHRDVMALGRNYWPGDASQVTTLGATRRVRALHALGYSWARLEREIDGYSLGGIKKLANSAPAFMDAEHAAVVRAAYDRLSMHLPTADNQYELSGIGRARNNAKRNGWAPPLAYDDIDDPAETPTGIYDAPVGSTAFNLERTAKRLADLEHAAEHGHTLARVLSDLAIGEEGLWKWCKRNDRDDLWRLFKGRQDERDGRGSDAA